MQDDALMGARFDKAIDPDTDEFTTNGLNIPRLSADDPDTAANELGTHLIVTGTVSDDNEAMFSISSLLGRGTASDEGANFVYEAVKSIEKVQADVTALLALDTQPSGLEAILDDIADILDALSSEDAFVAATAADGGGVFESQELGADAAMDTFNRVTWSATATMGATGATRYGTAIRKSTTNARTDLSTEEYGAFWYSTMSETVRTAQAAALSLTGIASYTGGTEAIDGDGMTYSGTMDLQVRFSTNTVSGVVKDLASADGLPWEHNFAPVERIVLDDARLLRNATWNNGAGTDATVFYTADSGLLRPITGLTNTFRGILLGTGADAGSQANGLWSLNASGSTNYLTGGFGVMHVGDAPRPLPGGDEGGASNATLMTTPVLAGITTPTVSVSDGKLTVKVHRYGWADINSDGTLTYQGRTDADGENVLATAEFDLEALAANGAGATTTVNGPKWVDSVMETVQAQRDQIATLQSLGTRTASTRTAEAAAWQTALNAVQCQLFGGNLPNKLVGTYSTDTDLQEDSLDLLDRVLDALSNANNLFAATDPEGTGIFDRMMDVDSDGDNVIEADPDGDPATDDSEFGDPFIVYDATGDRRWEFAGNNRALAAFLGEREHKVIASLGTTSYTRFGVWYRIGAVSAERAANDAPNGVKKDEGGPGSFAYSPLDPTMAGNLTNPAFPIGSSASFVGETVAIMDEDTLTGTARVDVSWASATSATPPLDLAVSADGTTDVASHAGTMSLTLGNLVDSTGDPLTYFPTGATGAGQEIAEIVFDGMAIEVGLPGANSRNLIVGAQVAGTAEDGVTPYTYGELQLTPANSVRYRLSEIGMSDQAGVEGTTNDVVTGVAALFVGQGVDGPLGVIGTFTLDDDNVVRVNAAGTGVEEGTVAIYGGFGADIP